MAAHTEGWPLAEFGLVGRDARSLAEERGWALPKPSELERLRKVASKRGVGPIDEIELALDSGKTRQFELEHGPTSTPVGGVQVRHGRWRYRLLWLLDGRTYELFRAAGQEDWLIYADAREVGVCRPTGYARTMLVFRFPDSWRIDIGDEHALSYYEVRGRRPSIRIEMNDGREVTAWSGMVRYRDLPARMPLLARDLGFRRTPVENRLWFLPRDSEDRALPQTPETLIALVALSMLERQAFFVPEGD
ncbi:hypothetical protein [Nodularia spumigena]|uniref:hypothetical protein n=1 Tax=Nodularia spumigena TaxID=70799 RepID=UPI002B2014E3|nr:hypothetical protein [Nodularia spumigena]MEA5614524.1 hypothetical protein [Nodularia spumigena UHCC 0040]